MFSEDTFSFGCIPSAPSCFECLPDSGNNLHESTQTLVDQISNQLRIDEEIIMASAPSNSIALSAEAPSLAACDTNSLGQESTSSSKSEIGVKDCISQDQEDQEPMLPPNMMRSSLVQLISNCSVGSGQECPHCPICLDPMTPIDHQHPLQCPTPHCTFNFCASCINSLLSSSKDDFQMASDGNAHVKIYLNCPNCRADLVGSIRDVLLLRKVDTVNWLLAQRGGKGLALNPSQQRTKQAMQELHVQEAIQVAREKEVVFWKTHHSVLFGEEDDDEDEGEHKEDNSARRRISRYESSRRLRDGSFSYEEWGVEADLEFGVHSSFRMPEDQKTRLKSQIQETCDEEDTTKYPSIDETLLQGLEGLMLHAEQLDVTHWMTSGDPDELVQAAQLLRRVEEDARKGIKPADRQKVMNRRGSLYEIVAETRELMQEKPSKPRSAPCLMGNTFSRPMTQRQRQALQRKERAAEHMILERQLAERASLLQRCPLPVRMPKAVTLELRNDPTDRRFPLRFCNDNWDGTVLDAYTKLTVAPVSRRRLASGSPQQPFTVSKKPQTQHPGVFNVVSQGQYQRHYGRVALTMEQPPRVLIASVQVEAGRQGVMKGDVVTHVDGQAVGGKTVDELVAFLRSKREAGQESIQVVFNAEASIAEALKRRSLVMDD